MDLDGEQMDEQMEVDLDAEEEAADPDEDARPQPSAAVRAFQVEVDAARDEYKRFVRATTAAASSTSPSTANGGRSAYAERTPHWMRRWRQIGRSGRRGERLRG